MRTRSMLSWVVLSSLVVSSAVFAGTDDPSTVPTPNAAPEAGEPLVVKGRTLHPMHGLVGVGDKLATLDIPPSQFFLAKDEARYIVEEVCHNPQDPTVVGLVMPTADEAGWMTVISYDPEHGHVADSDAKSINFSELLTQMKEDVLAGNEARKASGYDTATLLGWSEPPHYDPAQHKLYWAKRLAFSSAKGETLNYCVRVLTRRGVLEMNTIDEPANLATVAASSQALLASTTVLSGERYQEFDSSIDKIAVGGIAALIAGGVLAKTGLLAVIGKFLIAFIKPILIGLAVAGGWIWKFVKNRMATSPKREH